MDKSQMLQELSQEIGNLIKKSQIFSNALGGIDTLYIM